MPIGARVYFAIASICTASCARGVDSTLDLETGGIGGGAGVSPVGGLAGSMGGAGGSSTGSGGGAAGGGGTAGGGGGMAGSSSGGNAGIGIDATAGAAGVGGQGGMDASAGDVFDASSKDAPPEVPCPGAGTALSFNGAQSQTVIVPGAAVPSGNSPRTIEMWILSKSPSSNWAPDHTPFEHGGRNSLQAFGLDLDAFAMTRMELYLNPSANSLFFVTGVGQDTWFHVASVYDGTMTHAIVNGVEKGALTPTGGALQTPVSSLYVGSGILRNYFTGSIDEVRIWNVARTAAQVAQDMNYRLVGNEPGLVAYYRFDEGSGTVARDGTSGANNGTLTNGPAYVASGVTLGCR